MEVMEIPGDIGSPTPEEFDVVYAMVGMPVGDPHLILTEQAAQELVASGAMVGKPVLWRGRTFRCTKTWVEGDKLWARLKESQSNRVRCISCYGILVVRSDRCLVCDTGPYCAECLPLEKHHCGEVDCYHCGRWFPREKIRGCDCGGEFCPAHQHPTSHDCEEEIA